MKEILILNGATRQNGNTKKLIDSFIRGAKSVGNNITEFYLQNMNIHGLHRLRSMFQIEFKSK